MKGRWFMCMYMIGEMIRHHRKQKKISQEELAFGIMNKATLSRIENGNSMPTKYHIEALLERLGVNISGLSALFLTAEMAEEQRIIDELDVYLTQKNTEEAGQIIAELDNNDEFKSVKLNAQFLFAAKAANAINMKKDPKEVFEMLESGLKTTGLDLSKNDVETYLLTDIAFKLFTMLAIAYFENGEHDKAIAIWYGLEKNIKKNCVDVSERGRRYPQVMTCLAKAFNLLGRHEEVLGICRKGKKICIKTRRLRLLPELALYEAYSRFELGDKVKCEKLLREAYHTFSLFGQGKDKKATKKYAKEKLGISL